MLPRGWAPPVTGSPRALRGTTPGASSARLAAVRPLMGSRSSLLPPDDLVDRRLGGLDHRGRGRDRDDLLHAGHGEREVQGRFLADLEADARPDLALETRELGGHVVPADREGGHVEAAVRLRDDGSGEAGVGAADRDRHPGQHRLARVPHHALDGGRGRLCTCDRGDAHKPDGEDARGDRAHDGCPSLVSPPQSARTSARPQAEGRSQGTGYSGHARPSTANHCVFSELDGMEELSSGQLAVHWLPVLQRRRYSAEVS